MPYEVFLYRHDNGDGSSKDWAYPVNCAAIDPALTVFYGRTGSTLRQADTPSSACRNRDPHAEALVRVKEKTHKGYRFLGRHQLADNRRNLTPVDADPETVSVMTDQSAPANVYWRWRTDSATRTDQTLAEAVEAVVHRLAAVGWSVEGGQPGDDPERLWRRISHDAYQGCIELSEDNAPRLAFFLLLARAKVGLRIANEAGEVIASWPKEVPIPVQVLETLGLKPRHVIQWLAAVTGDDWFFE